MSDEIQGLTVKLGITDNLFQEGVGKINKAMNVLQSEFKATASNLQNFGDDTDKLGNKADYLSKTMELQKAKIQALKDAYEKAKVNTGEFSDATNNASIKLNNAIASFNKMKSELKNTQDLLEKSKKDVEDNGGAWDKLKEKIANSMKGMGDSIKNGIGMAIGHDIWDKFKQGSVSILTFGSDFQKSMNQIQSSTGLSDDKLNNMKGTLQSIYDDNFGESFEDIGKALSIVQQGWRGNNDDIKGLTENALLLRDTFDFDVNESFRSANMLIEQFGLKGDEAYSLIAQGAQNGLNKNEDLLDTVNEYSVQFKGLGFNATEMFNILQNGAKSGTFSIDKLGDAVKEFGIRAKDGSTSTQQAFQALGLDVNKTEEAFAKGGEAGKKAYEEVNKKLLEMKDPLKQNQVGTALWGTMWEDLGKSGISSLTNLNGTITTSTDALNKMNKVKYNDLGSAFEGIKRNLQTGILLPLSEKLLPKLSDFSNWFTANMPKIKETVSNGVDAVTPVLNDFGKAFGFIKDNADWLIPVLAGVVGSIGAFNIITAVNGLMDMWKASTFAQTLAQEGLNVALKDNPIGLVITIIGLLIVAGIALYMHWDDVKAAAVKVWDGIKATFQAFSTWLGGVFSTDWSKKFGFLGDILNGYLQNVKNIFGGVKEIFSGIIDFVTGVFTGNWSKAWNGVKEVFKGITDTFVAIMKAPLNGIISLINGAISGLNKIKIPDWVPQVGGKGINIPKIPLLEKGGIVDRPTFSMIGEHGKEAVMPLENNTGWIKDLAGQINKNIGGNDGQYVFTIPLYIDGREVSRATARYTSEEINRLNKNYNFGFGGA